MPTGMPWTKVFCSTCGRKTFLARRQDAPGVVLFCGGCSYWEEDCSCDDIEND